jgi:hypothetical protein
MPTRQAGCPSSGVAGGTERLTKTRGANTGSKHIYLGLFSVEADAASAYDRAMVKLRGPNAATNFALSNVWAPPLGNAKSSLGDAKSSLGDA